jgi:hypothetical protein
MHTVLYYQLSRDDHHVQHGVPEDVLIVRVRSLQGGQPSFKGTVMDDNIFRFLAWRRVSPCRTDCRHIRMHVRIIKALHLKRQCAKCI